MTNNNRVDGVLTGKIITSNSQNQALMRSFKASNLNINALSRVEKTHLAV